MFGSHLSVSGGFHKAALAAEKYGFDTIQIFTAPPHQWGMTQIDCSVGHVLTENQQQWKSKPLESDAIEQWCGECSRLKMEATVSHDSYLINLASPDEALRRKSIDLFVEEVRRCMALRIPLLVTHPGAHVGEGDEAGLRRVSEALDEVHATVPEGRGVVVTCLESTAGQGSSLGHRLEHLSEILSTVKEPDRLGVCLDTAHLFAAGYDFRGRKYSKFRKELESLVGVDRVKVLHLNDSKKELGSRVDRHEHIGRGTIGVEGFKPFVRDEVFDRVPKILETAKGKDDQGREWDAVNLEVLKGLL